MSLARALTVSFLGLSLLACSSSSVDESEDVEQSEEALISCGAARYNEAFSHYKRAVDLSKGRLRDAGVCEESWGMQWEIADEASRAVMTCGAFRNVIKTSPWAAPVRQVLASSLTLRSLTGELLVIKDSDWQNWSGVDRFFTEGGLTFWARAEGAYGSTVRVDFQANGQATWHELYFDQEYAAHWRQIPATYTIAKSSRREAGPRIVTVKRGDKSDTFSLGVENGWQYRDAPIMTLTPLGTGNVLGDGATSPRLYSLVDECSA
jgi:hypothetical protein